MGIRDRSVRKSREGIDVLHCTIFVLLSAEVLDSQITQRKTRRRSCQFFLSSFLAIDEIIYQLFDTVMFIENFL